MQILGIFYLEISGVSAQDNGMTMRKRKESQPQHFEALSVIFSSKTKNCHYAHKPLTLVLHFRLSLSKWDYTAVWWMQLRKQNQTTARHLNNVCHILFISVVYLMEVLTIGFIQLMESILIYIKMAHKKGMKGEIDFSCK